MKCRRAFDYDSAAVSDETGLECLDPSLAQQSQAEEADINTIVRKFGITGVLPQSVRPPTYGDFTDVMNFQEAQDAIIAANRSFMAMPADVRTRFSNDPGLFVDFCSDPKNLDEMRKLGLADPAPKADTAVAGDVPA
jgi:phage internal scaffolding protein